MIVKCIEEKSLWVCFDDERYSVGRTEESAKKNYAGGMFFNMSCPLPYIADLDDIPKCETIEEMLQMCDQRIAIKKIIGKEVFEKANTKQELRKMREDLELLKCHHKQRDEKSKFSFFKIFSK